VDLYPAIWLEIGQRAPRLGTPSLSSAVSRYGSASSMNPERIFATGLD
jgi:hypothetical protein